ncbi:hypothetical protein F4861DRAFT_535774 [Xylaria intraflava]|nr:hypothetical protein F4861DRAFT_535774 [Xylaria intraflava]
MASAAPSPDEKFRGGQCHVYELSFEDRECLAARVPLYMSPNSPDGIIDALNGEWKTLQALEAKGIDFRQPETWTFAPFMKSFFNKGAHILLAWKLRDCELPENKEEPVSGADSENGGKAEHLQERERVIEMSIYATKTHAQIPGPYYKLAGPVTSLQAPAIRTRNAYNRSRSAKHCQGGAYRIRYTVTERQKAWLATGILPPQDFYPSHAWQPARSGWTLGNAAP